MKLYEVTFKEGEKESRSSLEAQLCPEGVESSGRPIVLALVNANHVYGGIIFSYLAAVNGGFISYLMIAFEVRHQGLGTELFHVCKSFLDRIACDQSETAVDGIFTELEKESPEKLETYRRFQFWDRLGVFPLDTEWVYPELRPGQAPVEMYLAYGAPRSKRRWTAASLSLAARAIFSTTYADVPSAEEALEKILAALAKLPPHAPIPNRWAASPHNIGPSR
jgi:hypothetical protein